MREALSSLITTLLLQPPKLCGAAFSPVAVLEITARLAPVINLKCLCLSYKLQPDFVCEHPCNLVEVSSFQSFAAW